MKPSGLPKCTPLNVTAFVLFGCAAGIIVVALPSPFFRWALLGSLVLVFRFAKTREQSLLHIALFLPVAVIITSVINNVVVQITPLTIDPLLLRTDLGVSRAFIGWSAANPRAYSVIAVIYDALPLPVAVVLALSSNRRRLAEALVAAGVLAVPLYLMFPAVGPLHVRDPLAARNCIPSLHLAWALLLVFYSRGRLLVAGSSIFATLTAIATLATGEHYVIDLVFAVPFAWAIYQLVNKPVPAIGHVRETDQRLAPHYPSDNIPSASAS